MRRTLGWGAAAGLLAVAAVLLTPAGLWVATRLLGELAARHGWEVRVGRHTGSLLTGLSLRDLSVGSEESGVAARVERLDASLWSRRLDISTPVVSIELGRSPAVAQTTAAPEPPRLPVEHLPALRLRDGAVEIGWVDSARRLRLEGLSLDYEPIPAAGRLRVAIPSWCLQDSGGVEIPGELRADIRLEAGAVGLDSLRVLAAIDTLRLELRAEGRLTLARGYPIGATLQAAVRSCGEAVTADGQARLAGELVPLALRARTAGAAAWRPYPGGAWAAAVRVDSAHVWLDSLHVDALQGSLDARGGCALAGDSVWVELVAAGLQAGQLFGDTTCGPVGLRLRAVGDLAAGRYGVDAGASVRGLALAGVAPMDLEAALALLPDGSAHLAVWGEVGRLEARGRVHPAAGLGPGGYDLDLAGRVHLGRLLQVAAAPVLVRGHLEPDDAWVRLRSEHPPGAFGRRFGEWVLDLWLRQSQRLEARLGLEQGLLQGHALLDLAEGRIDTLGITLAPFGLDRLLPELGGTVRGRLQAAGPLDLDGLRASAAVELDRPAYGGWSLGPASLRLDYDDKRLRGRLDGTSVVADALVDSAMQVSLEVLFTGPVLFARSAADSVRLPHEPPGPAPASAGSGPPPEAGPEAGLAASAGPDTVAAAPAPSLPESGPAAPACRAGDPGLAMGAEPAVTLTGRLAFSAPLADMAAGGGRLDLDALAVQSGGWWARARSPLAVGWRERVLDIQRCELDTPLGPVSLAGHGGPAELAFDLKMPALDVRPVTPALEARGGGELRLQVGGTLDRPAISGLAALREVVLDSLPVGSLEARLEVQDSLDFSVALSQHAAADVGDVAAGDSLSADRRGTLVALREHERAEPSAEPASACAAAAGSAGWPAAGLRPSACARVRAAAAPLWQAVAGQPQAGDGSDSGRTLGELAPRLVFALDTDRLDLGAVLTHALGLPSSGWVDLHGQASIPIGLLAGAQASGGDPGGGAGASGAADRSGLATPLPWRWLDGRLHVGGLHVSSEVNGVRLVADMLPGGAIEAGGDRLDLRGLGLGLQRYDRDLRALTKAGTLMVDGALGSEGQVELDLTLDGLDLLALDAFEGWVDAEAHVRGTVRVPAVDAQVRLRTAGNGAGEARLTGGGDGAAMAAFWVTQLGDSLSAHGRVPWDAGRQQPDLPRGELTVRSSGIDLSAFADLLADYEVDQLAGRMQVDLRVSGLDSTAAIDGEITVDDLAIGLADIQPTYRFPHGRLTFAGRRGRLVDFVSPATAQNGRMELTGHIDLERLDDPRYELHLATRDLRFRLEDVFDADAIDLDVGLAGTTTGARLGGSVRVDKATAEPLLVVLGAPPVPPPPPALRDEFLENMQLDLLVDIRDLKVDSELARAEVSGAINVGGTFYKPIFQGDIQVDAGSVFILNRQFEFERGRVVLNSLAPTRSLLDVAYDPLILDPELDLVAHCKVVTLPPESEEYQVTLAVQGTALAPLPEFTSSPALDLVRVFRLLAFGSPDSQMDYGTALGTAAGQLLSKQVERVGLDEFMLLPSGTVMGTVGLTTVRLGKYVDQLPLPVWVRYEAPLAGMSTGQVDVEHQLTRYLTISGMAHSTHDLYGLGLGLKREFR